MKNLFFCLVAMFVVVIQGCRHQPPGSSPAEPLLKGEHTLQEDSLGRYFIFTELVDSIITDRTLVQFKWLSNNKDSSSVVSILPLEKLTIVFDETQVVPCIRYRWEQFTKDEMPTENQLMRDNVLYAVITLQKKYWPVYKLGSGNEIVAH